MEVQLPLVLNQLVVPEDRVFKVEAALQHLPNPLVSSHSMVHRSDKCHCSIHNHLECSLSSLSLDTPRDSLPDLQVVPRQLRLAKEDTVVLNRDHNLDLRRSRLVVEDMVVQDQRLVLNLSHPGQVMEDRVDRHLRPDRNRSAVGMVVERMEL